MVFIYSEDGRSCHNKVVPWYYSQGPYHLGLLQLVVTTNRISGIHIRHQPLSFLNGCCTQCCCNVHAALNIETTHPRDLASDKVTGYLEAVYFQALRPQCFRLRSRIKVF